MWLADAMFLQAERHQLLRGYVSGMRRRLGGFYPAVGPALQHAESMQHALIVEA